MKKRKQHNSDLIFVNIYYTVLISMMKRYYIVIQSGQMVSVHSCFAYLCRLLITLENSLDPDQN